MKNIYYIHSKWIITVLCIVCLPPLAAWNTWKQIHGKLANPSSSDKGLSLLNDDNIDPSVSCQNNQVRILTTTVLFSYWTSTVNFWLVAIFSILAHEERISSVKHLSLMTGLSPFIFWLTNVLCDASLFLVFAAIMCITFGLIDSEGLLTSDGGLFVLFLILILSGTAMICFVYFTTFLFKTLLGVVGFHISLQVLLGLIGYGLLLIPDIEDYVVFMKFHPLTCTIVALDAFMNFMIRKLSCSTCPAADYCTDVTGTTPLNNKKLTDNLIFLAANIVLYFMIIVLIDYGLIKFIWSRLERCWIGNFKVTRLNNIDVDVVMEKRRVESLRGETDNLPLVIVDDLGKKYSRKMIALNDVTFAVSEGECFGLLGKNGAGKTTVFNILSGMIYPTKGNIYIKTLSIKKKKTECLSYIGYCPQHSALIDCLTGRQMLKIFAWLRLIQKNEINHEVDKWISVFGLAKYQNRPCGTYSGGNKRKLSTAIAFIGNPRIVLLDEPTSGVDPFIRRNFWSVIAECKRTGQAVIISSHSMDECEAVCNRLTILAQGWMECIGNVQHLKAQFGKDYVLTIKLNFHTQLEVKELKDKIQSIFGPSCQLKDEIKIILYYVIDKDSIKMSQLFDVMESLKEQFDIIEDYVVVNSSLEQVFLSFGKT